ncbi:MAG: DNA polymerase Y family protein [Spirochaeta sp.]|nr:DNA polymerase Y family protein [Spirochaeta sp.]
MALMVCISLPALALQLLIQREPQLRDVPAAVMDEKGLCIRERNRAAADLGIEVGLRYGAALTRAPALYVEPLQPERLAAAHEQLVSVLYRVSDRVERHAEEPGVYWLSTRGLLRPYDGVAGYCTAVRERLAGAGWAAAVAAGHSHFGAYVAAKRGLELGAVSVAVERRAVRAVGLDVLGLDAVQRRRLERLAVRSIGDFLRLPEKEVELRFGRQAGAAYRLAAERENLPVLPCEEAAERRLRFVPAAPVRRLESLYAELRPHMGTFLDAIIARGELVTALFLKLEFEDGSVRQECVRPAEAGCDLKLFDRLVRLRLDGVEFPSPVQAFVLEGESRLGRQHSLELFPHTCVRSAAAEERAYSFLRARFGENAVSFAHPADSHLPEKKFCWYPEKNLGSGSVAAVYPRVVRRLFTKPRPFSRAAVPIAGPYIIATEWWQKGGPRSYYYLYGQRQRLLWVYFDAQSQRWMLHGGL